MRIGLPALRNIQSLIRHFSSSPVCAVDKSALSTLRKNTGYTFTNCKKALDQFGDDLVAAEKWLRDQAQKEGWAKATKLQDRVVSQGLIGVKCNAEDGTGVLLEVNCMYKNKNATVRLKRCLCFSITLIDRWIEWLIDWLISIDLWFMIYDLCRWNGLCRSQRKIPGIIGQCSRSLLERTAVEGNRWRFISQGW